MMSFAIVVVVVTGCANAADKPSADPVTMVPSPSTVVGLDSYTFEGLGQNLETVTAQLSGSYSVTWEVSNNYFEDSDDPAMFYVTYVGPGTYRDLIVDEYGLAEGSGSVDVDDLAGGDYHLEIISSADAEWSVTFQRL